MARFCCFFRISAFKTQHGLAFLNTKASRKFQVLGGEELRNYGDGSFFLFERAREGLRVANLMAKTI